MAFCQNCGAAMQDGAKFCPSCGSSGGGPKAQAQQSSQQANQQQRYSTEHVARDAEDNKLMGILAYLGILVLVPIFAAKESPFARYHANQGLTLAICEVAYIILISILNAILFVVSWRVAMIFSTIFWIISLVFVVLAIMGIINAVNGRMKPLPVIGGITILK